MMKNRAHELSMAERKNLYKTSSEIEYGRTSRNCMSLDLYIAAYDVRVLESISIKPRPRKNSANSLGMIIMPTPPRLFRKWKPLLNAVNRPASNRIAKETITMILSLDCIAAIRFMPRIP